MNWHIDKGNFEDFRLGKYRKDMQVLGFNLLLDLSSPLRLITEKYAQAKLKYVTIATSQDFFAF